MKNKLSKLVSEAKIYIESTTEAGNVAYASENIINRIFYLKEKENITPHDLLLITAEFLQMIDVSFVALGKSNHVTKLLAITGSIIILFLIIQII